MPNNFKKFNSYGKLNSVMLGRFFYPEFFSSIKNSKIADPLKRMSQEINEDLEIFESILKNFGCTVLRPDQPTGEFLVENPYIAPLHVRNNHCVIGNQLYQLNPDFDNPITPILSEYCNNIINLVEDNINFYNKSMHHAIDSYNKNLNIWFKKDKYLELAGADWPDFYDYVKQNEITNLPIKEEIDSWKPELQYETKELGPLQGPNVINTNDKIFVTCNEYCNYKNWIEPHLNDVRPVHQFTSSAGHIDGCFSIIGENLILGIHPFINYEEIFNDYEIIKINPNSYQMPIDKFNMMKREVNGKWWLDGEEHNTKFINFVETNLKNWVGFVEESIFDVNVLNLDEKTVCVSNITEEVKQDFKKHNIDYIVVPWRHRFFVDGGLHCITLDLHRE